jgi:hypothetical protein
MARDPMMIYWVAIVLLSFLLLSSEQQNRNNDNGRFIVFVDSFTIAPVVTTTTISTANTKARRIPSKVLTTSRTSRTSKIILFSSVNENNGEGDGDDDDDDDDGWGTKTAPLSSDSSSSDDTKNQKIKELKLLQQQQSSSASTTSSQVEGTENQVVERDLFIPIFAIVSLLGLGGAYGYETLRLASRGELYLPWQQ